MTEVLNKKYYLFFFIALFSVIITSCKSPAEKAPDVSHIELPEVSFVRSEQMIAAIDTTTDGLYQQLLSKDSIFFDLLINRVLGVPINRLNKEEQDQFIKGFISDQRIMRIQSEVDSVFGSMEDIKQEFEKAFQYMKYYFPQEKIPDLYSFISEYSLQRFIFDNTEQDGLAIGLDMFLGEDYPYKSYVLNNTSFSDYLTRTYNKEHLVRYVMETWVEDRLIDHYEGETLLDKMIYHGKKLYILSKLLPETEGNIIMAYNEEQWQWCQNNEQEMWAFFFKEELFYSTDINKISKLVSPSPHSSGMPPEAPGRTANYMGWQIVKAYMNRSGKTLKDLIDEKEISAQKILEQSKFKPKRD